VRAAGEARGLDPADIDKAASAYDRSPLAVAVIESPKPSDKIPAIEMTYSAGAVCLALLNAALAAGWGANWLSGWPSHQHPALFGAQGPERVAGIIHIGTETTAPPERPRPDVSALTTWVTE
jgi:nitroreductase